MTIDTIIPAILNSLVSNRVWQDATPDDIPRDSKGVALPFVVWTLVGGQDAEYVGQTMGSHSNARVQITSVAAGSIAASNLCKQVRDKLLASAYTVGVYGSPLGTYDAARKLRGRIQQFSIWYPQP